MTDEYKYHQLSLNYSKPISNELIDLHVEASVWVETGDGSIINYIKEDTHYASEIPFAGSPGETYQLHFTTAEGKEYQSNIITLVEAPEIDSVYDQYVEIAEDKAIQNVGGIQFFLDTHDETQSAKFFRYEWQEDYKIITPYQAHFRFLYPEEIIVAIEDTINICYARNVSQSILIANTIESGNRIAEFPIRFVSGETDYLRNRYAILVKQYAVSPEAYNYYRKFKELNESTGSLFDQQQGALPGNVVSMDDPYEVVLGYFEVAGQSELRTYFNYEDLDPHFLYPEYRTDCGAETIVNITQDSLFSFGMNLNLIRYYSTSRRADIGAASCTDCTGYGKTQKPDFWIDK